RRQGGRIRVQRDGLVGGEVDRELHAAGFYQLSSALAAARMFKKPRPGGFAIRALPLSPVSGSVNTGERVVVLDRLEPVEILALLLLLLALVGLALLLALLGEHLALAGLVVVLALVFVLVAEDAALLLVGLLGLGRHLLLFVLGRREARGRLLRGRA